MPDKPPLVFEARLGGLFPANRMAEEAVQELRGRVIVTIKGGVANQKRRGLYWSVCALIAPILNDMHGLTLTEQDLHDITRDKLGLYEAIPLPSGEVFKRFRSTSNRSMNESERADYTTRALALWSRWTGIDVDTLRREGEAVR